MARQRTKHPGAQDAFYTSGPLAEAELKELERRLEEAKPGGAGWYIPHPLKARLVQDNRRLRNLLLDYMDDEE